MNLGSQLEKIAAQKIFLKNILEEIFLTNQIYDLDFERIGILLTSDAREKQEAKKECEQKLSLIKEKVEGNSGISISFHGDVENDKMCIRDSINTNNQSFFSYGCNFCVLYGTIHCRYLSV